MLLALVLAFSLSLVPFPARGTGIEQDAKGVSESLALVTQGRALYRGSTPLRQPPTLHGVALPAGANRCASCHGAQGLARSEAGVVVPAIQWQRLGQATGTRAAYTDAGQVLRAVMQGRASDGRSLNAPMPHFELDAGEQRALLAYLRVLGTDADPVPGVDARRIVLGTVLPQAGAQQAAGASVQAALQKRIAAINAAGGIFGRQLELVVADAGPNAASATRAAIDMAGSGRVFALVASWQVVPDDGLRDALATSDTAMVATLGLPLTQSAEPLMTWLLPSLRQQTLALAAELQRRCPQAAELGQPVQVLYPRGSPLAQLDETGRQQQSPSHLQPQPTLQWQAVDDAASVRVAMRSRLAARTTIALLPEPLANTVRDEIAALGAAGSCLGTLAALSGQSAAPSVFPELIALPMSPVALEGSGQQHTALWPLLADSAMAVMAEGLARTGRQLDTARLLSALDTLHHFEPRPGLSLSFSARQRHGFDVFYLWKEGPHENPSSRR